MKSRAESSGGADDERQLKNSAPPAPHEWLAYERPRATIALWWGAADPPTPGPEKHQKSFRRVGESFLDGIRVAHKRLQEHNPAPTVWTHFSDDLSLFESHKMLYIHPASRGVAAHTAGLFRSVRGAKGGFPRGGSPS